MLLFWWLLLITITWSTLLVYTSTVFMATKEMCITNSSAAMVVNTDLESDRWKQDSSFLPPTRDTEISCKLSKDDDCTKYWIKNSWELKNSLDGPIKEIVTDRRWEEFETLYTEGVDAENEPLKFVLAAILSDDQELLEIPISIRAEKEAHMFLCDGKKVDKSSCYWFMLQAWKGDKTAIRKCQRQIPAIDRRYPREPCKILRNESSHLDGAHPKFIFENEWRSFKIIKLGNRISFSDGEKNLIEFTDNEIMFKVKYLFFHTKVVNGLWKIHKYEYAYTQSQGIYLNLEPDVDFRDTEIMCISMHVIMCKECKLQILILGEGNSRQDIYNKVFETKESKWTEIKIVAARSPKYDTGKLVIYTAALSGAENIYWAIGDIRTCNHEEYRVVEVPNVGTCQLMENPSRLLKYSSNLAESVLDTNCPVESFGRNCVPCDIIYHSTTCQSKGNRYCELDDNKIVCFCNSGYREQCNSVCNYGYYGHGCKRQCGRCYGCDPSTGRCHSQCRDNFRGETCDIPPIPILKFPPDIIGSYFHECNVEVRNFATTGNEEASFYKVQYTQHLNDPWMDVNGSNTKFKYTEKIMIENLKSDEVYFVRAVLYSDPTEMFDNGNIKYSQCRTTCLGIKGYEVIIESEKTSAIVEFQIDIRSDICHVNNYMFYVNDQYLSTTTNTLNISGLNADSEYTLIGNHTYSNETFSKSFRTKEGAPGIVTKVTSSSTSRSITLHWEEPLEKNGQLQGYLVSYKFVKPKGCFDSKVGVSTSHTTTESELEISELEPYSCYAFEIMAFTVENGPSIYFQECTTALDDILDTELPDVEVSTSPTFAYLKFYNTNCENYMGPLEVTIEISCQQPWCTKDIVRNITYQQNSNSNFRIVDLFAFTMYSMKLSFCRKDNCQYAGKEVLKNFTTKTTVPNRIKDFMVTSKSSSTVSFRWTPPYPPTGILEQYEIEYTYHRTYFKNFKPQQCRLWPNFHCITIFDSEDINWTYDIQIRARNQDPVNLGEYSNMVRTTVGYEEAPLAPYDINVDWSDNLDANITWKHPNATYGLLRNFDIVLLPKQQERRNKQRITRQYNIESEDDYRPIYSFYLTNVVEPCKSYRITITGNNKLSGTAESIDTLTPPEKPLDITNDITATATNTSITLKLPSYLVKGSNCKVSIFIGITTDTTKPLGNENAKSVLKSIVGNYNVELLDILETIILKFVALPKDLPMDFIIGNNSTYEIADMPVTNSPLIPRTTYIITVLLVNHFEGQFKYRVIQKEVATLGEMMPLTESGNGALYALLLILLVPIAIGCFIMYKKKKISTSSMANIINAPTSGGIDNEKETILPMAKVKTRKQAVIKPAIKIKEQPAVPAMTNPSDFPTIYSKAIKITNFEEYVKNSIEDGELDRQHALFPRGQTKPWDYGALPENKSKNRYNNLIAYNHTRVKLKKINGDPFSDYINANYIDGYKTPRTYIATQGPKASTLNDFWRMIWQENVQCIVMLANIYEGGKKKVAEYWPSINEVLEFGPISVQYMSGEVFAYYERRTFNVTKENEHRKVEQIHFHSWPDHGVPLYPQSLVPLLQSLLKFPNTSKSPIVIHCSAGVGRTGTIILCDISLRMAARRGILDMLSALEHIRNQRPNMVDNVMQYKLAHLVVLECLNGMPTAIPCGEDMEVSVNMVLENDRIKNQMKYLTDTKWQDDAMKDIVRSVDDFPDVPQKNRFPEIVPEKHSRIFISRYPTNDEKSCYINAVYVDGFRSPNRYIVTQQPMSTTLGDFWRLVHEKNVTIVISLQKINDKDKTSCKFWPQNHKQIQPVDYLTLRHQNTTSYEFYSVTNLELLPKGHEKIDITLLSLDNWLNDRYLPNSIEEFLTFWKECDTISRGSEPILVTCYNGATGCGLYVAMSFLIDKMNLEHECDVCQAVRYIRHNRDQFVENEDQFRFLYKASVQYVNGFQCYANFSS